MDLLRSARRVLVPENGISRGYHNTERISTCTPGLIHLPTVTNIFFGRIMTDNPKEHGWVLPGSKDNTQVRVLMIRQNLPHD
jgi:hypothetical protein